MGGRRAVPVALVALGLLVLLGWYVVYTRSVVRELGREASRSGRMYARVYTALNDPRDDAATAALLDLSQHIREMGVPIVLTDTAGRVTASANLAFDPTTDTARARGYIAELDRMNPPADEPGIGKVHYGNTPLVRGLRVIPLLQAGILVLLLVAGVYGFRTRGRAERERVWAGMARESAHQLGTPLSSLSGWIELLREHADDSMTASAVRQMTADLERLERVAHRFERIGRPPRQDEVDMCDLAERVASYFRARVPTLAQRVTVVSACDADGPLIVRGDAVLLEWALEALAKNAVDALTGRGGRLDITAQRAPNGAIRLRVADDGPGVPRELRQKIFSAGFSTKRQGWGIGLALSKRIVEETHGGKLVLVPSDSGATFDVILP